MSKLKIYGPAWSRANRVLWLANELGLDYEQPPIDFMAGEHKQAAFLAINPNGRVPAIEDGTLKLSESLAINLYLAKHHGGGALYPQSPAEEAGIWQWTVWAASDIEMPLITALVNRSIRPPEGRDLAAADAAETRLQRGFGVLETVLTPRPYLLGEDFTLADLAVASVLIYAPLCAITFDAYPHLAAWLERCYARPAYRALAASVAADPDAPSWSRLPACAA
ncbi:MAG TPA: glutathione S-transferase family protein [Aliidongia sp.]|nr:glutathione S-transferase family protein [Aliidongia sp.]